MGKEDLVELDSVKKSKGRSCVERRTKSAKNIIILIQKTVSMNLL